MSSFATCLFLCASAFTGGIGGAAAVWSAPPATGELLIVVAGPWSGGADAVVSRAGGGVVGPDSPPLSVLATGAWAVLSADIPPSFLCLEGG